MKHYSIIISLLALLCGSPVCAQENFALGADISWVTEMESRGAKFYNTRGQERECTALMKECGLNAIRLRVWVDPSKHGNWCNKEDVLQKALRAKALGMDVMIDFHYGDWWCDPGKQPIPQSWEKLSYKKMRQALADHTTEVLTYLKDNGVTPRWVQIGNETSNGLLWSVEVGPNGWEKKDEHGHTIITRSMGHAQRNPKQYAGFIRAGYDAAKKVLPQVICIVHLDNGFDQKLYDWNLDLLLAGGAKWDMIGMSLYPYWARTSHHRDDADQVITDCMHNIRHVSEKYGTDVMIVETGMEVDEHNPAVIAEGYRQLSRILSEARDSTDGHCKGVFYWEPECQPRQYKLGAFDSKGRPTHIMEAFRNMPVRTVRLDQITLSDPCILADQATQMYYMTGTGGMLWKSRDLKMWTGPYRVALTDPYGWMGPRPQIWAAELHKYRDKYYYFATFTNEAIKIDTVRGNVIPRRASHILVSDRPDGPFYPIGPDNYLPADRPTLDGTFWIDTDQKPYMVFCGEWLHNWNGTMERIQLSDDLSRSVGEPQVMFRAFDAPWSREKDEDGKEIPNKVTDGPYLFRTQTGRLGMIWTSWIYQDYTQGVAYSESGTLAGPWIQEEKPITPPNFGHGMLFRTLEGKLMMSVHSHENRNGRYHRVPNLFPVDDSGDKIKVLY